MWQSKAEHGERIASIVPYGYRKSEDNPKQWVIDEPAAQTVRKIFALCLAGKGPMQIARLLEEEQVLVPAAYFESVGRKHAQKVPKSPYGWEQATVGYILENRQYTGGAVNSKSTTVSYKVHKRIQHGEEDYQIIPDMQEAIISEEQWLRVQELRKHKRRPTKTGRTSLFSGLVYCYDGKAKMHFAAAKSMKRKQEHFRCSQYKSGRGECAMHYIRDIVLERLVLRTLREMTDIKELTPTLVNSLIERIEVHNSDKSDGHSHVKVDIYFTAVGMIDIPTEKEILATMKEIRNNPQDFKFVA